jgi:transcriptional regulator with XRE-family HTH domain
MNRLQFGQRIKTLREAKNLTQQELADRIGIKRPSLTAWELGTTKKVKDENILAAARELETTPEYLLYGKEPAPSPVAELEQTWDKLTPSQKHAIAEQARVYAKQNQDVLDNLK